MRSAPRSTSGLPEFGTVLDNPDLTDPDEIAVPPKPAVSQGWGIAIAKSKEALESR